ncbi:hypothetical protein roselon_01580 [Roseibacterium elongatum DSM 19469]|uniref:Uncharacterized protein n=1 Tax=Roseicyclus elongatus DSM 19469 TaxID=1294273 RepID=W8S1E2_9RHOB|nr:hypothetical protein roselon_01580 [Roseibacterium elongatum DSM 19469]
MSGPIAAAGVDDVTDPQYAHHFRKEKRVSIRGVPAATHHL